MYAKTLKFCLTVYNLHFWPYLGVSKTPYLGSCSLSVQEDLTGEQALLRFLVWKGNYCSGLLYKLCLKQQLIKEQGFTLKFLSELACSLQLDLHWGSVFASRLRTRVFNVLFSFVNWILSGSWSRYRVIFSKLNQNQRVLRRSIYIEPVLNVFADLF